MAQYSENIMTASRGGWTGERVLYGRCIFWRCIWHGPTMLTELPARYLLRVLVQCGMEGFHGVTYQWISTFPRN
jgi:hypothetical protein